MNSSFPPRHPRKKSPRALVWGLFIFTALLIFSIMSALFFALWLRWMPNQDMEQPHFDGLDKPIFMDGEKFSRPAEVLLDELYFPLSWVKQHLDPSVYFESETQSVIVTTLNKTIHMKTDQLTYQINQEPFNLQFPIQIIDEEIYFPVKVLKSLYGIHIEEVDSTGAIFVRKPGEMIQFGVVKESPSRSNEAVPMRKGDSMKEPILYELAPGSPVFILDETEHGWYEIQLDNGYKGYMLKSYIKLTDIVQIEGKPREQKYIPWKPIGGKINLTWEAVYNQNPDTNQIGEMPGLNVISPTWFHLQDGTGKLRNMADAGYVKWAHDRGYQVWALFSNDFEPERTSQALRSAEARSYMIKQLLSFAELYDLQGINIDFENVYLEDKDYLTQFVRELTPLMHEQGLVVSIDVTIRGGSPMWSLFYDRKALGEIVDYMMVMTYDEHYAASPVAGSVASLPWVEKGITDIIKEDNVPPSKIILAVPLYTRLWTETIDNGKMNVTSQTQFMQDVEDLIRERKLTPIYLEEEGQHYIEFQDENESKKIWIEDEISMKARVKLVRKHNLAGIASWRRGFELPQIWDVIKETLEERPISIP